MIIPNFEPFVGQHCETTATGSLLKHLGIHLSEPMLFGLGQGLGFIYWDTPKQMDFPFLGGRIKPDELTQNICQNLGLNLDVKETSSTAAAWKTVAERIDRGIPVGLKVDCYHLDYFTEKIHFTGHYVAMYGYDETYAYLVDTNQQGSLVKSTLANLALARNEKGHMASPNRSYSIAMNGPVPPLKEIIPVAIKKNAVDFLNPPIKNIGYKGIEKTSQMVRKWFDRSRDSSQYELAATLMEKGGTGGSLFRNLYRDFLKESLDYVPGQELEAAYEKYCQIVPLWNEVSCQIEKAGQTFDQKCLDEASRILLEISKREKDAVGILCAISPN